MSTIDDNTYDPVASMTVGFPPEEIEARSAEIPRWAFERMEQERSAFFGVEPNPANVDVFVRDPFGWSAYHAFVAYIARLEQDPESVTASRRPLQPT